MRLFLKTEKSKAITPGPISVLRPCEPRRLKQANGGSCDCDGLVGFIAEPSLGGAGLQYVFQNAKSGAVGIEKHCVLM